MRLVLMGPPGAGKGTQAVLLKDKLQIPHISTGDIFREKMKDGSDLGNKVKGFVEKGELVPDEVVIEMVKERLEKPDTENGFILDGFPRTKAQGEALEATLKELGKEIDFVLDFQVEEELIVKRLSGRRVCKDCGAVFNVDTKPTKVEGVCDSCGSHNLIQRKDDAEETVRNRIKVYHDTAAPLQEFYKSRDLLHTLDSSDGTQLGAALDKLFQSKQ